MSAVAATGGTTTEDVAEPAAQMMPYLTAAAGAYGGAVLGDITDASATAWLVKKADLPTTFSGPNYIQSV